MGQSWFLKRMLMKGEYYWFAVERTSVGGKRRERSHSLGVKGRHAKRAAQAAFNAWMQGSAAVDTPPAATSTCGEYLAAYLNRIQASVRPRTLDSYRLWLGRAGEFWRTLPLGDLRSDHIEQWKAHLAGEYAPNSVNIALRALKTALRAAVTQQILRVSPMSGVRMAQIPKRTFPPYITIAQFEAVVLPHTPSARLRMAFSLAMYAGLRRAEIANLRWHQVDLKNSVIRVESTDDFQTKSGHGRLIPLYPPLENALKDWKQAQGRSRTASDCYVISGTTVPADDSALTRGWTRRLPAFRSVDVAFPPVSLHGLRHSFATHLAMSGLNLHTLKSILGHADIQTTMIYAHVEPSRALDLARSISF